MNESLIRSWEYIWCLACVRGDLVNMFKARTHIARLRAEQAAA